MPLLQPNILKEEYEAISNDIYASFFTSPELTDSYAKWLKSALLKNAFPTKEQKAHVIRFLAKLQTQKEVLWAYENDPSIKEAIAKLKIRNAERGTPIITKI